MSEENLNVCYMLVQNSSVHYWIENGAPRDKLVLGMGTYGRGVTLDNPKENGIYAPGNAPLRAGPYTREKGFWGYNEVNLRLETRKKFD